MIDENLSRKNSIKFIIFLGIVSLFADMTYQGSRSIIGPYLSILGASGAAVGIVAGFGELIGYTFRFVSGYISDKTGRYWAITFFGYLINLIAVPLLALAGKWETAAVLIVAERFGKAIRIPARDAMISYAAHQTGTGRGFGLHKALDQLGAILGPFIVTTTLYFRGSYQMSFAILFIPAFCALVVLIAARFFYPNPQHLEVKTPEFKTEGFSTNYWVYIAGASLVAAGYIDFPLISYHFKKTSTLPDIWIPIFYAIAMGAEGLAALVCGRLYDKKGISILIGSTMISSLFALFAFSHNFYLSLIGISLWGIGMGAQGSIMRAVIAHLISKDKRGTGYGTFNMFFGLFWFFGSALMGFLYDFSVLYIIIFSIFLQNAAIPLFIMVKKGMEK